MAKQTRAKVAEGARLTAFFAFLATIAGWAGFANQLDSELPPAFAETDGFGIKVAAWLVGAVLSTALMTVSLGVAWMHQYLEAER